MLVGKDLGPFLVEKELGSGAMGTVYRAKSKKTGAFVAIKLMALALGSSDAATNRFVREVAILKQLDHPNIVKYKGSGRYHKAPFYIMEYVEGESLDHVFARRKKLPWEEVVEIGIHLCAALQHAHDQGIIHRDLKPSNLMILADGTVKLTDFGIAKDTDLTALTNANSTVGTAAYMSPEQCRGARDIGHKSDLYSMGIMFYELLTGKKPFVGETPMEVFLQHANKRDYKRPAEIVMEMPTWLNVLVEQLMEKEISKRPQNAKAVADSLRLIKEKVAVQRGTGKDAVPKRKKDKAVNGDDKDGASSMMGMRKKKEAAPPFYTKGWFTMLAVSVVVMVLGVFSYYAFLRTPDAETLYNEAAALRTSDAKGAREGPIADFLRYYPDHAKKSQVQEWADKYDFDLLEKQMLNRRNKSFKIESPEEQTFRAALDDEDAGKFAEAATQWDELSKRKNNPDLEKHAWGLLGARYAADLKTIDADYDQLKTWLGLNTEPSDEFEKLALEARKKELDRDKADPAKAPELLTQAREKWEELKQASKTASPRRWHLLASKRLKELK
jgi:eukaryotic-like serine/threonine-protein kinase